MSSPYVKFTFMRSFTAGHVPTLDELPLGQILLNVPDAKVYIKQKQPYGPDKIKLIGDSKLN